MKNHKNFEKCDCFLFKMDQSPIKQFKVGKEFFSEKKLTFIIL